MSIFDDYGDWEIIVNQPLKEVVGFRDSKAFTFNELKEEILKEARKESPDYICKHETQTQSKDEDGFNYCTDCGEKIAWNT